MAGKRIIGLDVWRAVLVLGGPLTHAAQLVAGIHPPAIPLMAAIEWGTHLFRMQAFFFISGILSGMADVERPGWVSGRLLRLGLPLVSAWLLLLVPLNLLMTAVGRSRMAFLDPQHLWFLCVLIIANVCFGMLGLRVRRLSAYLEKQSPLVVLLLWTYVAVALAMYFNFVGQHFYIKPIVFVLTAQAPRYGMYFLAGAVLSQCPRLMFYVKNMRFWWIGIVAWMIGMALVIERRADLAEFGGHAGFSYLAEAWVAITGVLMCLLVTHTALRIKKVPDAIKALSEGSFTIYLFHYPIVSLLGLLPNSNKVDANLFFVAVAGSSLIASYATHLTFSRFTTFCMIFNGDVRAWSKHRLDTKAILNEQSTRAQTQSAG